MSLLFMDSFDHYATADLAEKWDTVNVGGSGSSISTTGGRWSSRSYHCTNGNAGIGKGTNPGSQVAIFGAAIKVTETIAQIPFWTSFDAVADQTMVVATINQDGSLSVWRCPTGNTAMLSVAQCTVLGTTPSALLGQGVWNYIEIWVTHDALAGVVRIAVNGDEVLNLTGQDTAPAARTYTAQFIGCGTSATMDFDDVYMADDQGAGLNDFVGDSRIECIFPDAEGSNLGLTPSSGSTHYVLVDETTPNDDTDYVTGIAAGLKDTYNYSALVVTGTVIGVQVNMSARKNDSGVKEICPVYRQGGADLDGSSQVVATDVYRYYREITEENPHISGPWTISTINGVQFGVKVVS